MSLRRTTSIFQGASLFGLAAAVLGLVGCTSREKLPVYTPFTRAWVRLEVKHEPADTVDVVVVAYTNIPRDASSSGTLKIRKAGNYFLQLEVDRPAQARLSLNDSSYNILTVPMDTVSIDLTAERIPVGFSGKHANINTYLLEKRKALKYDDMRIALNQKLTSRSTFSSILRNTDSIVNNELSFLAGYLKNHSLPDWFIHYETAEIRYLGMGFKLTMPLYNELFLLFTDTLPNNYFDFLKGLQANDPSAILSSKYYWFLDDYFLRGLPYEEFSDLGGYSRETKIFGYIKKAADSVLSGEVKDVYHHYIFSTIAQATSDSVKLDSIARDLQITDFDSYRHLFARQEKTDVKWKNLQAGEVVMDFVVVGKDDETVSIREFQDRLVYLNFWATWCGPCIKNIPELNHTIESYHGNKSVAFLNICINSDKDKWKEMIAKQNLKGINLFANERWSDKLKAEFNIKGVPTYVLLGKRNKLLERNTDKAPNVKVKLDKILKEARG